MKRALLILTLFFLRAFPLAAQDPSGVGLGFSPYQSYHVGDFDSINLANGDLLIHIPLISYPQRGTLPALTPSFFSNSPRYVIEDFPNPPYDWYEWWPVAGGGYLTTDGSVGVAWDTVYNSDCSCDLSVGYVREGDGAEHTLGSTSSSSYRTIDASGFNLESAGNIVDKNGVRYHIGTYPYSITDPSGNTITVNYSNGTWTDSVGRTIPDLSSLSPSPYNCPNYATKNFPGPPGSDPVSFTFTCTTISIQTSFGWSWVNEYSGSLNVLYSIALPNGTTWVFTYDAYGNVASVTLPTGGKVSYTYGESVADDYGEWISEPAVTVRTVTPHDSSQNQTWQYTWGNPRVVTNPDGTVVHHTFTQLLTGAGPYYETKTENFTDINSANSPSNSLKTVDMTYSWVGTNPFFYIDYNAFPYGLTLKKGLCTRIRRDPHFRRLSEER